MKPITPRFRQAVVRLSQELQAVLPGVNDDNIEELFTSAVFKVAAEFPDINMAEVGQVIDRLSALCATSEHSDPERQN